MTLPDMLAALRREEQRTGAVVVTQELEAIPARNWPHRTLAAYFDFSGERITDGAARLVMLGGMSEWLSWQGLAVVSNTMGFWITLDVRGNQEVIDGHLDDAPLEAHFAACASRLAAMPAMTAKEGC